MRRKGEQDAAAAADTTRMSIQLLIVYIALAGVLMRSVLVKVNFAPPSCGSCGLPRERRELGEAICSCH
jgi:hypothetical protein